MYPIRYEFACQLIDDGGVREEILVSSLIVLRSIFESLRLKEDGTVIEAVTKLVQPSSSDSLWLHALSVLLLTDLSQCAISPVWSCAGPSFDEVRFCI